MKLVFLGTPAFAVPTLQQVAASCDVAAVVTNPDRPSGRGQKLVAPAVKQAAAELDIPCLQPESPHAADLPSTLAELGCDLFVVVAFSILPPTLLAIPRLGSVNLHPSLLPAYRGAAPIVWALFNGETETGVTTFLLNRRVDAGDILLQRRVPIDPDETAGELEARLAELGAHLVVSTISGLERGDLQPCRQGAERLSRAPKLTKEDGRLEWNWPSERLRNRIRGANPMPGAFCDWRGAVLKIHRARVYDGLLRGSAGTVLAADGDGLVVATGDGALVLDEVQPAGKGRMPGPALARGYDVAVGHPLAGAVPG